MGFMMPRPYKIGDTYYLRLHVPRDVAESAKGRKVSVTVGDMACSVTVGGTIKVSLRTRDSKEAKARHALAQADAERLWGALRDGPKALSHKQSLALAGEFCAAFIADFDEDPGDPETWERVIAFSRAAMRGPYPWQERAVIDDGSRARLLFHRWVCPITTRKASALGRPCETRGTRVRPR
jgi:hypothetical protein